MNQNDYVFAKNTKTYIFKGNQFQNDEPGSGVFTKNFSPPIEKQKSLNIHFKWNPKRENKGKSGVEFRDLFGRVVFALARNKSNLLFANKGKETDSSFASDTLKWSQKKFNPNKIYNVTPEDYSIESIIVFGSFIRGDNNIHSDIDFLIVIDNCSYNEKLITKLNIAEEMQIPPSWISIYTTDEIYDLCLYGDSFLWSIKLEGLILYSRSGFFEYCLYNLRLYTNMTNDIASNYKKLRNISYDFNTKTVSNATLIKRVGYIIRNTLTILAYTAGVINYNKYEVYDICKSIPGFYIPFSKESYIKLLDIKSYIKDNSLDADSIPNFHQYIKLWIKKAFLLVRSSYYKIIALTSRGFSSPFIDYL